MHKLGSFLGLKMLFLRPFFVPRFAPLPLSFLIFLDLGSFWVNYLGKTALMDYPIHLFYCEHHLTIGKYFVKIGCNISISCRYRQTFLRSYNF